MRPHFGCQIHDLVFASNDESTWGLTRYYVDLTRLRDVGAAHRRAGHRRRPNLDQPSRMDISLTYRVRATKDARTLVYPFYLITPEEEGVGQCHCRT